MTDLGGTITQMTDSEIGVCTLGTDGSVRCFGRRPSAGYGTVEVIGDEAGEMPPPPLDLGPDPVTKVVLSAYQGCVLTDAGDVRCWAGEDNTWGYLGNETIGDEPGEMPPPPVGLSRPALDVFASSWDDSFCAILDDHSVECWGMNVVGNWYGYAVIDGDPVALPLH